MTRRRTAGAAGPSPLASTLLAAVLALAGAAGSQAGTGVPEPQGYHGPPYNGAVTETLRGANVIDPDEAMRLHAAGVPFIDVLPRIARPEGLPAGTLWREPVHASIPGALWLFGTGYERLSADEEARLTRGLAEATAGDRTRPVVIFCRSDCWMGWNAARRAIEMGYRAVRWFPDGVEGWEEAGGTLVPVLPSPY